MKILYLEDNQFDSDLTCRELINSIPDVGIESVRTIKEANTLLHKDSEFNLAILDLNLPDGNGIDSLIHIRQMNLPVAVIILTGSGNEESAIAALKAGADDYLTKNQDYHKKLPNVINNVLENFKKNINRRSKPLNVLYVEWNKPDIEFTKRHLHKYAPQINIDAVTFATEALELLPKNANEECKYDVLLIDYRLPGLNALDTVKIIKQERKLPISIVLVTGHGNEEIAVQALKLGADEYLVKRDNYLFRLPSLLINAFQRQELERQQTALRESEAKYRLIAENVSDVIFMLDLDFNIKYVSPAVKELRGVEVEEAMRQKLTEILTPASYQKVAQLLLKLIPVKNEKLNTPIPSEIIQLEMIRKDGTRIWTEIKASIITDENNIPIGIQGVTRDITKRKEAIDELLKSREEYRNFFEEDLTGDFISTTDGKLLNCNPAFLNILGFVSKELALEYDIKKIHVKTNGYSQMIDELNRHKKLILYEFDLVRIDGKIINVIANIIGNFDENGILQTLKGYLIDDTKRKKANAENRILSRAMDQSPASVVITNLDGLIEYTNPKFTEVSGYTLAEVRGQNPRILKSGSMGNEVYTELWETIKSGKTWTGEFFNKRKDGSLFWEYGSISPIKDENGNTTHYLAVKEDITEKKRYEDELIISRDKAQESDRLKSAFLATMSHELRTPLNAIIGFSDLINEDMKKKEIVSFANIIRNSGNHLLKIIEDVFSVSLLQSGHSKVVVEEIHLSDFFQSLIQYTQVEIKNRNKSHLKIIFQPEVFNTKTVIKTDKTKLNQVLINFIKNAIEYTIEGKIEIGFHTQNDTLIFFVKDTGIGIKQEKVDLIFERFRQIDDSHTRLHGGVGLGLAICTEIAKLLNGKIWVESDFGKGSTFYFSLTSVSVSDIISLSDDLFVTDLPDFSNKTILIVEDNEFNYLLLEKYIHKTKANIINAKTGEESIEICKFNQNINLVLMDIGLEGINGFETTLKIKEFRPELTIIAQSAFALENDRKIAFKSKCDDYISKPILFKALMKILSKYLS